MIPAAVLGNEADLEQYYKSKLQEISQLWSEEKFAEGTEILEELYGNAELLKSDDKKITITYCLACGYSLLNNHDKAFDLLAEAIEAGYTDYTHIQKDTDLNNIRDEDRFKQLMDLIEPRLEYWDSPFISTQYNDNLNPDEKIAGLSKLWSEIKYNFAFFNRVPEVNWDSLYMAYLPRVKTTQSTSGYYRVLMELCAQLKDGHTGINPPPALYNEYWAKPPIRTQYIEGRILITKVDNDSLIQNGIRPGLELTHIDGLPVKQYAEERVIKYVTASTAQGLIRNAYGFYLLAGSVEEPVELTVKDENDTIYKRIVRRAPFVYDPPEFEFEILDGNIGYVNLPTFDSDDIYRAFDSVFNRIMEMKALVIDIRENGGGNSSVGYNVLACLTDSPFPTVRCKAAAYRGYERARGQAEKYDILQHDWPSDKSKYYDRPVVLLIGSFTASAAEDFAVVLNALERGQLLGEPTAGTTGQPLMFQLPGGGSGRVCTIQCTYPDGREFVGYGVKPDILIRPTVDDIRSGHDIVLETALQHLR